MEVERGNGADGGALGMKHCGKAESLSTSDLISPMIYAPLVYALRLTVSYSVGVTQGD